MSHRRSFWAGVAMVVADEFSCPREPIHRSGTIQSQCPLWVQGTGGWVTFAFVSLLEKRGTARQQHRAVRLRTDKRDLRERDGRPRSEVRVRLGPYAWPGPRYWRFAPINRDGLASIPNRSVAIEFYHQLRPALYSLVFGGPPSCAPDFSLRQCPASWARIAR